MIYIFSAHPDDAVTSCGGTIAKYVSQGKKVMSVIFSYGENRNPILDPAYLTTQLITASKKAFKILGSETLLLGLPDSQLKKHLKKPEVEKKIKNLFRKHPPKIIVTHNKDDPRTTHKAITTFVIGLLGRYKPKIYTFGMDLPFRIIRAEKPKLYIDISHTSAAKQRASRFFKSDRELISYKETLNKLKDRFNGFRIGAEYAEVFYKI